MDLILFPYGTPILTIFSVDVRGIAEISKSSIEQRLAAVETAVRDLQRQLANALPSPSWLDHITGSFKDKPAFEEVLKYGREWRQADQLAEEPEASA